MQDFLNERHLYIIFSRKSKRKKKVNRVLCKPVEREICV